MSQARAANIEHSRPPTGRTVGRYELLHPIARGGMGAVFLARATSIAGFERVVAVKLLHAHLADDPAFIAMFLDEATLAARIRHPNVVATLDVGCEGATYYLVMDYVEGQHLAGLVHAFPRRGLPPAIALRITRDVLAGLAAAHEVTGASRESLGVVHRDVSPQNVLVGADGIARLIDFGVAKAEHRSALTAVGQLKGKLAYMAPEQIEDGSCDVRTDLYAMGVVLWEMLSGLRLHRGSTEFETRRRVLEGGAPRLAKARPELAAIDAVLERALARDPDARFGSAREMLAALERVALPVARQRAVAALVREIAGEKLTLETLALRRTVARIHDEPTRTLVHEDDDPSRSAMRLRPRRRRWTRGLAALGALSMIAGAVGLTVPLGSTPMSKAAMTPVSMTPPRPAPVIAPPAHVQPPADTKSTPERRRRPRRPRRDAILANPYR